MVPGPPASALVGHSSRPNFGLGQIMAVLEALQVAQADVTPERFAEVWGKHGVPQSWNGVKQKPHVLSALAMGSIVSLRSQHRGPAETPLYASPAMPGMRSA
ncbi:hypothetical protein C0989_000462 [Termitomyces sp. Mn162]|nr:hypothetical protein C0989_000462 [Termitomyces sp. Mn162]